MQRFRLGDHGAAGHMVTGFAFAGRRSAGRLAPMSFTPLHFWLRVRTVNLVRVGLLAGVVWLAGGCASVYQKVTVQAWAVDQNVSGSFAIRDVSRPENAASPQVARAMELLKDALRERGYREAAAGVAPGLLIDVEYGVQAREKSERLNFPALVLERGHETIGYAQTGTNPDGTPQVQPYVERTPDRFVTRDTGDVYRSTSTVFGKFLRIVASTNVPSAEGKRVMPLWRVQVSTDPQGDDGRRDLGSQIPVLMAASFYFLGKNSGGTRLVEVNKNVAAALLVADRGGQSARAPRSH